MKLGMVLAETSPEKQENVLDIVRKFLRNNLNDDEGVLKKEYFVWNT